jgi:hypothetical protein
MNAKENGPSGPVTPVSRRRETLLGLLCGIGVLVFIGLGVMTMGDRQQSASSNTLTGKVIKKTFTPRSEDQVSFGSRGTSAGHVAGEYVLEVHVKQENRTFQVPVDAATYEAMRPGASFSFMRPRSEQSK